jgi:hypothetical protein
MNSGELSGDGGIGGGTAGHPNDAKAGAGTEAGAGAGAGAGAEAAAAAAGVVGGSGQGHGDFFAGARVAARSWRVWYFALTWFFAYNAYYGILFFGPLLIGDILHPGHTVEAEAGASQHCSPRQRHPPRFERSSLSSSSLVYYIFFLLANKRRTCRWCAGSATNSLTRA